ncbi:cytoplasmic dynein light chain, putative [Ricinus communis]|uniref:Dynein light chain n=1 Tax=Ricinus communis TaxID=3988 RepID=B9RT79_RICCO|nr:cytoplasmic dynein light chain, putative [Ricinus communis]
MSTEEAKRSIIGGLVTKPISDDPKVSPATPPTAKKIIIKNADMKVDMQKEAVDIAIAAFEKNNVEKDVAEHIKKEFDRRHGPTWHCIVGRNFVISFMIIEVKLKIRCYSCKFGSMLGYPYKHLVLV